MIKKENESPKTEDQLVFINCSLEKKSTKQASGCLPDSQR